MKPTTTLTILTALALALATASLIPLAAGPGNACAPPEVDRSPKGHNHVQQTIFFAVLEGLYTDGVSTETARLLASTEGKSDLPRFFVYGCPLCMPAFNAVRTYAGRPEFRGDKMGRDTFGSGLDKTTLAQLAIDDPQVRLDAFQSLILRWTDEYLEKMRLTPAESEKWASYISGMREKGNAILEQYIEQGGEYARVYAGWKKCPVCEGSNGAMKP